MCESESKLRKTLGIPMDAEKVLVFAESSHWDPNWLKTSEQYYHDYVQNNLDLALEWLQKEPQRRYSIECVFFLQKYWERNPLKHYRICDLMNQGRLWMTSSGVTTADTLIPGDEAILRDFLLGQEWLRSIGVHQEPRTAYFADSFGCSPGLPSLLKAAGFERSAFTRIDGMFFAGCDFEPPGNFPREGSSAELLSKQLNTQDFIWQDINGSEILCHWNAFTYGQGDMLAARGITRVYLFPFFFPDPSRRNVRNKIESYYRQLAPLSRTPYHFCPIGFDFVPPVENLVKILNRYNQQEYPRSGIWVINATLDDYLDLVEFHKDKLPTLQGFDPNPYWTGFYSSRPYLKKIAHQALDQLILTEQAACLIGQGTQIQQELSDDWWSLAVSNHHDLITGTSPDSIMESESYPLVEGILENTKAIGEKLLPPGKIRKSSVSEINIPAWGKKDHIVQIKTRYYQIEMNEHLGGCITQWIFNDMEMIKGNSNDLITCAETGGLWRMGHEFKGGYFKQVDAASDHLISLSVTESDNCVRVNSILDIEGESILREYLFFADSPLVFTRIYGRAPKKRTLTLRFHPDIQYSNFSMIQPGGVVVRPLEKIYHPTFWPMQSFTHVFGCLNKPGFTIVTTQPTAIASLGDKAIDLIALRNAVRETAFGFIGLPANPAAGFEKQSCAFEFAIGFTEDGDWQKNQLDKIAQQVKVRFGKININYSSYMREMANSQIGIDASTYVQAIALKTAHRGDGFILRLRAYQIPQSPVTIRLAKHSVSGAYLCDARERNLKPLSVEKNTVSFKMTGVIATIRLLLE